MGGEELEEDTHITHWGCSGCGEHIMRHTHVGKDIDGESFRSCATCVNCGLDHIAATYWED